MSVVFIFSRFQKLAEHFPRWREYLFLMATVMVMLSKLNFSDALESYRQCFFPNFTSTRREEKSLEKK